MTTDNNNKTFYKVYPEFANVSATTLPGSETKENEITNPFYCGTDILTNFQKKLLYLPYLFNYGDGYSTNAPGENAIKSLKTIDKSNILNFLGASLNHLKQKWKKNNQKAIPKRTYKKKNLSNETTSNETQNISIDQDEEKSLREQQLKSKSFEESTELESSKWSKHTDKAQKCYQMIEQLKSHYTKQSDAGTFTDVQLCEKMKFFDGNDELNAATISRLRNDNKISSNKVDAIYVILTKLCQLIGLSLGDQ